MLVTQAYRYALDPTPRQQRTRPAARVFQALRILINRELANLQEP